MKLQIQTKSNFKDFVTNLIHLRKFHPSYEVFCENEVICENDTKVGIGILLLHFGSCWEFALDRLDHQLDGFITTIHYEGHMFKVYRKLVSERCEEYPPLRRIK